MGTTKEKSFNEAKRARRMLEGADPVMMDKICMDSCVQALEPPKHRPLNPVAIGMMKQAAFGLESIAHLQGWERELLPMTEKLRELIKEAEDGQD